MDGKGRALLEGLAPFGRACPFWKGMPNFACLIGKGAPLLVNARPKESGIVWNLTYWCSIQCPDGVIQVVSTRGVAVSITGCRLKTRLPRIFFYRQPSRQASTPCPHPHAETAELSDVVFSKAKRFRNWSKVMLDPDFSVTAWVVSKCPQWGQRPHTKATMPQVGGGVCICAALVWGGREDQLLVQVGGGSPRLWSWRGIFGHAHVAYLIDRGRAPLLLTWLTVDIHVPVCSTRQALPLPQLVDNNSVCNRNRARI